MFRFATPRPTRKPSLTPMVDVVFLLLVFFMLAARFGQDVGLVLSPSGGGGAVYEGPPRLVEFDSAQVWLNGVEILASDLPRALASLMPTPDAVVILRPREGARVQDIATLGEMLKAAGILQIVVIGP